MSDAMQRPVSTSLSLIPPSAADIDRAMNELSVGDLYDVSPYDFDTEVGTRISYRGFKAVARLDSYDTCGCTASMIFDIELLRSDMSSVAIVGVALAVTDEERPSIVLVTPYHPLAFQAERVDAPSETNAPVVSDTPGGTIMLFVLCALSIAAMLTLLLQPQI